jgi:hypothetical protein
MSAITIQDAGQAVMLDRAARSLRIYRQQHALVLARIAPNCPGGRYSGKQQDYIRGAARKATLAILDAEVQS